MKKYLVSKKFLVTLENIVAFMIVLILVTALNSSPMIQYKVKLESLYYCIPTDRNETSEQDNHPYEVEVVLVSELAGTYYGEAIGADLI